jgi:hypothetical protein
MKQKTVVGLRIKSMCEQNVIRTTEDRLAHMLDCQARYSAEGYPTISKEALNDIGDIASVNSWQAHDPESGFLRFFPDTPLWVLEIAEKRHWVTKQELA